jgi:hypothetical protein
VLVAPLLDHGWPLCSQPASRRAHVLGQLPLRSRCPSAFGSRVPAPSPHRPGRPGLGSLRVAVRRWVRAAGAESNAGNRYHVPFSHNDSAQLLPEHIAFPTILFGSHMPPFPLLPLSIREGGRTPLAVGRFLRKQTHHNTGVTRGPAFGTREGATLGPPQARFSGRKNYCQM